MQRKEGLFLEARHCIGTIDVCTFWNTIYFFISIMTPHGPDVATYEKTTSKKPEELKPEWFDGGLAFMFESCYMMKVTDQALRSETLQKDYHAAWKGFVKHFDGQV